MERGLGSFWCLLPLVAVLLSGCCSEGERASVVIDVYTHNKTIAYGDTVPLGIQIILVCWVVGLPYGTPLSYTWTCPNGPCEVEGYYGRKIYNEHILAVNTTSTSDGGTYTCQVTATGGASGSFTLKVTGGSVVHSYGRLIPHEFPITDLQQISGPDGIGKITCTDSRGRAGFAVNGGELETGGVSQTENGATATLVVNPSDGDSFQNRGVYCTNAGANFFYLFISIANPLRVPGLMLGTVTNSELECQVRRNDEIISLALITGYEVVRFGVPMIGEYVNAGRGGTVTISPAVPGAQYRITAWALDGGNRSGTPAAVYATTREAGPSTPRKLSITKLLESAIELNWLPSTEPNGEVHYVIYYTPDGGTEHSMDTGSNLTHYNLTGLERNRVYTSIAVQAVNSVRRSERSAAIPQYNHTHTDIPSAGSPPSTAPATSGIVLPTQPVPSSGSSSGSSSESLPRPSSTAALAAGVAVTLLVAVVLLSLVGGVVVVVLRARRKIMMEAGQSHSKAGENPHKEDNSKMYQNVQSQPTPTSGYIEPDYSTAADAFINPASATASFKTHMYEIDQPSDIGGGGVYEEARVQWSGGGHFEEPVKSASEKEKKSAAKKIKTKLVKPEDLYTEPNKVKKDAKNSQVSKNEGAVVSSDDLYAQPDMTKKKTQKGQQDLEQKSEKERLPPQAPLPYKKHKETKHEFEEDEEDVPELPPPYVPDEEQHNTTTRDGDGPSSSERRFEYAALDWHKK